MMNNWVDSNKDNFTMMQTGFRRSETIQKLNISRIALDKISRLET